MEISNDIAAYYSLKPLKFRRIDKFQVNRSLDSGDPGSIDIVIEMRNLDDNKPEIMMLYLDGCRELRIGEIFSQSGIMLDISAHRSEFFEAIQFKVFDSSGQTLSLMCSNFAVETSSISL